MKIKKQYLEPILEAINYPVKKFAQSRLRDRLLRPMTEEYKVLHKDRQDIYLKYCLKDKDDKPVLDNNRYQFSPTVTEKLQKDIDTLYQEEVDIKTDVTWGQMKDMVENSTNEFKSGDALVLDEFLTDSKPKPATEKPVAKKK